ncbi:MAG: GrpB family protein [Bacillus sp. (in: firmicutes)]
MQLGLGKNEVKIVPYNKEWKKGFLKIKEEIQLATGLDYECIEHIGSTAIVNIAAKPVIDILVGVSNLDKIKPDLFKEFEKIGFYRLRVGREQEIVLAKFTDGTFKVKTHFIHLVKYKGDKWSQLVTFRDILNKNKGLREEYELIKLNFTSKSNEGINEYTNLKEEFVLNVINKLDADE